MEESKRIIEVKDKPHYFEFGTPGRNNHHKISYNTIEELNLHLQMLQEAGFDVGDSKPAGVDFKEGSIGEAANGYV